MADSMRLIGPSAPGFQTQTIFSLQIIMTDNDGKEVVVGTASELSPSQDRSNTIVGGVGIGDRILEVVPGRSKYDLSIKKFALWKKPIYSIFGYHPDVRMIAEMQRPFDIKTYHIDPNVPDTRVAASQTSGSPAVDYTTDRPNFIVTIYKGCVIKKLSRRMEYSNEAVIVDDVECDVTAILNGKATLPSLSDLV